MAKRDDVFPSKYLKAADLGGKPLTVTIEDAPLEELKSAEGKSQTKTVLYFRKAKKMLPLNRVNWDAVANVTGEDDSENWAGHKIELYPTTTEMKGKMVDCICIRLPEQPELPKTRQKPLKKSGAAEKPPLSEEMSDEIPF
jgi:hypothetical protein